MYESRIFISCDGRSTRAYSIDRKAVAFLAELLKKMVAFVAITTYPWNRFIFIDYVGY